MERCLSGKVMTNLTMTSGFKRLNQSGKLLEVLTSTCVFSLCTHPEDVVLTLICNNHTQA